MFFCPSILHECFSHHIIPPPDGATTRHRAAPTASRPWRTGLRTVFAVAR